MSEQDGQKPPERATKARVISLVDRLSPARRALVALREHDLDRDQKKRVERMAESIALLNPRLLFAEIKRIGKVLPGHVEAAGLVQAMIAAQRLLEGDAEGAFEDWERIIAQFPGQEADVCMIRCTFRILRGELDLALADVNRAIELQPTTASHYARRGDVLSRMGHEDAALANFRRAVQLDHDDLIALAGLGLGSLLAGDAAGGLPYYTRALRMYPRMVELRLGRALCYEDLGRTQDALADIEAALRYNPKDAEARYARGRIRPDAERALAIDDFTASIALDDENAEVWAARAHAYHMLEHLDRAIEDATRALALDRDNVTALFTRAIAHHRRGDYDAARADYDDLVRAAPDEPEYAEMREKALAHLERVQRGTKA